VGFTPGDFRRRLVLFLLRKLREKKLARRVSTPDRRSTPRTIRKLLMASGDGNPEPVMSLAQPNGRKVRSVTRLDHNLHPPPLIPHRETTRGRNGRDLWLCANAASRRPRGAAAGAIQHYLRSGQDCAFLLRGHQVRGQVFETH